MDLAVLAYRLSRELPSDERFALADQIRRSASSVPANIAEGAGRLRPGEFVRSLSIAGGSLRELETHLLLGLRLQYFGTDALRKPLHAVDEIGRMLHGLVRSLEVRKNQKAG